MNKFAIVSILSALCAVAAAQSTPDSVTIAGARRIIDVPATPYRMWPDDFREFRGSYALSNGKILYLSSMGRKMFAEVGEEGRTEIVAAAPDTFVALDRSLEMTFAPATGAVGEVTLKMRVPVGTHSEQSDGVIALSARH